MQLLTLVVACLGAVAVAEPPQITAPARRHHLVARFPQNTTATRTSTGTRTTVNTQTISSSPTPGGGGGGGSGGGNAGSHLEMAGGAVLGGMALALAFI